MLLLIWKDTDKSKELKKVKLDVCRSQSDSKLGTPKKKHEHWVKEELIFKC